MAKKLTWKARSYGNGKYCASACGAGCTKEDYLKAKLVASETARALGPEWKSYVHENMGWYPKVISKCGRIKVSKSITCYTAFLGEPDFPGGKWAESGNTAKQAVNNVIATAKRELNKINAVLNGLPV